MGTSHVADFLSDPRFIAAYQQGVATGSWHGYDLRWRVYNACWAAERALHLDGDFVECGVNRGGMSRSVIEYVDFYKVPKRFFLLDTYNGSPDVAEPNRNDYKDCYKDVVKTFSSFANIRIVRGVVPHTLPSVDADRVCYLSIDMNDPVPEVAALEFFWDRLVMGAVVLLDDYAYSDAYRGSKAAMDKLGTRLGFNAMTLPTGQGMIVKI